MGIKNLNQFLKNLKNINNIIHSEIHISEYSYKKIAIDLSNFMYKYKFVYGDNWMSAFIQLVACLRKNEVHCVFIYDNTATKDKKNEQDRRRLVREKDKQKIMSLDNDFKNYQETGIISEELHKLSERLNSDQPKRLLSSSIKQNEMKIVELHIEKIKNRTIDIKKEDFELSKTLLNLLGVPYYVAYCEAETMCSDLCKRGIVDAVLSEDSDVLAYGSPYLLNNINTTKETCIKVDFNNILKELELTYDSFLDMCIMCGCDYNDTIPGVGVVNAYKLMKEYNSIDNFENYLNNNLDEESVKKLNKIEIKCLNNIQLLNHNRCRELFKEYDISDIELKYCEKPNWIELNKFLFMNNCNFDINSIKKYFEPPCILFID